MDTRKPYFQAIGANLLALRAILTHALQDVEHGLEATQQRQQNAAVGSIIPTERLLTQAGILIQATLVLHRQN